MNEPMSENQTPPEAKRAQPTYRPWFTYSIIAVTVLVYGLQMMTQQPEGYDLVELYGAKVNEFIFMGEFWRLLTPLFLHGSIYHILFNMFALYQLGPFLEQVYGRARFGLLYFISGIAGNVVSFYLSDGWSVGASTAIFGLIAAQGVFIYRNRQFYGGRSRAMLGNIIMMIGVNLAFGLMVPLIDNWGHVGGLLGGLAFAWLGGPMLAVTMLPGGLYKVADQSSKTTAWILAGVEVAVLVGLTLLKVMKGS